MTTSDVEVRAAGPIEHRAAVVEGINHRERIITVIAVPWEQEATVDYRGELWTEVFHRGALDSLATMRPDRVRAYREHERRNVFGRATKFVPDDERGCVAEVYVAKTALGDETLALADDQCVSCSIGFVPLEQRLDRAAMKKHVNRAFLDHLAFVADPAYPGAEVIGVREAPTAAPAVFAPTPNLDALARDPDLMWALGKININGGKVGDAGSGHRP